MPQNYSLNIYTSPFTHTLTDPFWETLLQIYSYNPKDCCVIAPSLEATTFLENHFKDQALLVHTLETAKPAPSIFFCGFWSLNHSEFIKTLIEGSGSAFFWVIVDPQNTTYEAVMPFFSWLKSWPHREIALKPNSPILPDLLIEHPDSVEAEVRGIAQKIKEALSQGIEKKDIGILCQDTGNYAYWISKIFPRFGLSVNELPYPLTHAFCVAQFLEGVQKAQTPLSLTLYQHCLDALSDYPNPAEKSAFLSLKNNLSKLPTSSIAALKFALKSVEHRILEPTGIPLMSLDKAILTHKKILFMPGLLQEEENPYDTDDQARLYLFFSAVIQANQVYFSYPAHPWGAVSMPSELIQKACHYWGIPLVVSAPSILREGAPVKSPNGNFQVGMSVPLNVIPIDNKSCWSVTELETYQTCPQQYFYRYVLKEPLPASEEEISAAQWGAWLHNLLETWKKSPSPNSKDMLWKLAERQLAQEGFGWQVKRKLLFGSPEDEVPGLLDAIIVEDFENPIPLQPLAFEQEFKDLALTSILNIRGKIDVVLASKEAHFLAVMDYKTGSELPSGADIKSFRSLQLPFYLLAAQQLYPAYSLAAGIIYQVKNEHLAGKTIVCLTEEAKEAKLFDLQKKRPAILDSEFFQDFKTHITRLTELILRGEFSAFSENTLPHTFPFRAQTCSLCAYRYACDYPKRFEG